jgi:hypothetical protein
MTKETNTELPPDRRKALAALAGVAAAAVACAGAGVRHLRTRTAAHGWGRGWG